ncbi:DNA/RNA non-specific endonuclease [Streptomyces acidicola]
MDGHFSVGDVLDTAKNAVQSEVKEATSSGFKGFFKWGFKTAGKRNFFSLGVSALSALAGVESPTDTAVDWLADSIFGEEEGTKKQWVEIDRSADRPPLLPDTSGGQCNQPRSQRFNYQPLMDGAPTGATALICPQDLKPPNSRGKRQGTWNPPGYVSRKDREGNWIFNRSHIIGDRFHGDWIRENIFTGFKAMNDPAMKKLENKMASALAAQQPVLYSGQLEYGNGRENIPTGIRMSATTPNGILFTNVLVPNVP